MKMSMKLLSLVFKVNHYIWNEKRIKIDDSYNNQNWSRDKQLDTLMN